MSFDSKDRGDRNIDTQHYMEVLVSNVKELFTSEVSSVKKQIANLEEKLVLQLENHEKQSDSKIKYFEEEICDLKTKVDGIDKRVEELEIRPIEQKAKWIDEFWSVFWKVLFTAIATGTVGFLIYLLSKYLLT